ncbi:MAG UNVERIFIED_CONTAM: hypothetical protein LVR29_30400, partial [Microcystis novacekii LVE1205-3]
RKRISRQPSARLIIKSKLTITLKNIAFLIKMNYNWIWHRLLARRLAKTTTLYFTNKITALRS